MKELAIAMATLFGALAIIAVLAVLESAVIFTIAGAVR